MQLEFGVSQVSESRLAHAAIEFVNARAFTGTDLIGSQKQLEN